MAASLRRCFHENCARSMEPLSWRGHGATEQHTAQQQQASPTLNPLKDLHATLKATSQSPILLCFNSPSACSILRVQLVEDSLIQQSSSRYPECVHQKCALKCAPRPSHCPLSALWFHAGPAPTSYMSPRFRKETLSTSPLDMTQCMTRLAE